MRHRLLGAQERAERRLRYGEPVPRDSPLLPPELVMQLPGESGTVDLADELVSRARATGASMSFIEDSTLLADMDGVAALLRFTL